MKTFKEHCESNELKEGTAEDFEKANAGREGKTAVTVDGKEISGTIYLGDGMCIQKSGSHFALLSINSSGKTEIFDLPRVCIETIKKAHL